MLYRTYTREYTTPSHAPPLSYALPPQVLRVVSGGGRARGGARGTHRYPHDPSEESVGMVTVEGGADTVWRNSGYVSVVDLYIDERDWKLCGRDVGRHIKNFVLQFIFKQV